MPTSILSFMFRVEGFLIYECVWVCILKCITLHFDRFVFVVLELHKYRRTPTIRFERFVFLLICFVIHQMARDTILLLDLVPINFLLFRGNSLHFFDWQGVLYFIYFHNTNRSLVFVSIHDFAIQCLFFVFANNSGKKWSTIWLAVTLTPLQMFIILDSCIVHIQRNHWSIQAYLFIISVRLCTHLIAAHLRFEGEGNFRCTITRQCSPTEPWNFARPDHTRQITVIQQI